MSRLNRNYLINPETVYLHLRGAHYKSYPLVPNPPIDEIRANLQSLALTSRQYDFFRSVALIEEIKPYLLIPRRMSQADLDREMTVFAFRLNYSVAGFQSHLDADEIEDELEEALEEDDFPPASLYSRAYDTRLVLFRFSRDPLNPFRSLQEEENVFTYDNPDFQ